MMSRNMLAGGGIMYRMRRRCAIPRGDALRTSHMHRRLAGYFGAETKPAAAVMAFFVGHRAHSVALGMIAGSAAWSPGGPGSGNNDNAHGFILAVSSAESRNIPTSRLRITLELLTICSKAATYS